MLSAGLFSGLADQSEMDDLLDVLYGGYGAPDSQLQAGKLKKGQRKGPEPGK